MHMLGFITPNFLSIFVMIIAPLALFRAWIWVDGTKGKFLNDLGVTNIFNTKTTQSGSMLVCGWPSVLLHYFRGLNAVME